MGVVEDVPLPRGLLVKIASSAIFFTADVASAGVNLSLVCQIACIVVKLFNSMLDDYFHDVLNGVLNAMLIML